MNNLFTAVNVFDYLGDRPDAEDVLNQIADRLCPHFVDCEADIDDVQPDDCNFLVSMSAPWHMVDNGIGGYEYWGCRGVHHDYEPELDDEDAFCIDLNETALAAAGLSATATCDNNIEWGDDYEGSGTANCDETVTVYVTDPAKFEEWVATALAAKEAA